MIPVESTDEGRIPIDMSPSTRARVDAYVAALLRWNAKINLIGRSTEREVWHRHIRESADHLSLCPEGAQTWVDLGSGGGVPGLVVGILSAERSRALHVTLIESDQRKAAFLSTTASSLGLAVTVICDRIERAKPAAADIVSARALAPLPHLLPLIDRHLGHGGLALIAKGRSYHDEIARADLSEFWDLKIHKVHPNEESVILGLRRKSDGTTV